MILYMHSVLVRSSDVLFLTEPEGMGVDNEPGMAGIQEVAASPVIAPELHASSGKSVHACILSGPKSFRNGTTGVTP